MYIERDEQGPQNREHEPQQYRSLSRKVIYENSMTGRLMPEFNSRIIKRHWLIGVEEGIYYSLNRVQILQFEALLTFEDKVRNSDLSICTVVEKIDQYLQHTGQLPLGYDDNCFPDEDYIFRLARYVDPANILRIFRRAVPGAPPANGAMARL